MTQFKIGNSNLTVSINSFGAELCSVYSNVTSLEYIWQANKDIWARHAPNLFPIVGKLNNGIFNHQSNSYSLSQHGFARDSEFRCIEQREDFVLFELPANEKTLEIYPFHFSFQVGFKLTENQLEVNYVVFNPDNQDLYFSVGAHPAFNCPLLVNESFTDYELVFPNKEGFVINKLQDGLISSHTKPLVLTSNRLPISKELFENDALVFMNTQVSEVQLVSKISKHGVSLISKDWPFYGIWSKKGEESFICLEPWYGIADEVGFKKDICEKTGIIKIEPFGNFNCAYQMLFF